MARDFAKAFYRSKEWQQTREFCLNRDHYLCVICGKPAEEVHHKIHLNPRNINDVSITMNPDNLICLCKDCHFDQHKGEHGNGRKSQEDYPYEFDSNGNLILKRPPGA